MAVYLPQNRSPPRNQCQAHAQAQPETSEMQAGRQPETIQGKKEKKKRLPRWLRWLSMDERMEEGGNIHHRSGSQVRRCDMILHR